MAYFAIHQPFLRDEPRMSTLVTTCVGFFAARDIERGVELTFEYDFESGGFKCNSGAATNRLIT